MRKGHWWDGSFLLDPTPPAAEAPPESEVRLTVSRADLWSVADAARDFHRKAVNGRLDGEWYRRSREKLEVALERLPDEVWR